MEMNSLTATQSQAASSTLAQSGSFSETADFESFLQLFVTQLQYQDPLSPMDQTDFLGQTAQFSTLEQIADLNTNTQTGLVLSSQAVAASFIGKTVEGSILQEDGTKADVTGLVVSVDYGTSDQPLLGLQDGTTIPLSNVIKVQS